MRSSSSRATIRSRAALMPLTKGMGEEFGELDQRRLRFVSEAGGGIFGMADGDLLEIFHAPEIAILAHCAKIEARDPERPGADFRVPAVEAAEDRDRASRPAAARFDRVQVVDQEKEDVAVGCIERRRVLGDVDIGIVDPGRPVEHARHLPTRIAGAVAGDLLHGLDQLMVEDPAIVRTGDGAKLNAAVLDLERLDLLGAVRGQAVLQVDAGERRRELAQISGRRADQACKLAEAPVRRRDRRVCSRAASGPGARGRRGLLRHGSRALSTMRVRLRCDRALTDRGVR